MLLQHRVTESRYGGTWGIPGGALDLGENARDGGMRELMEETAIDEGSIETIAEFFDDHGGWAYTTVLARAPQLLATEKNWESKDLRWVPLDEVADYDLHPSFRTVFPYLTALL